MRESKFIKSLKASVQNLIRNQVRQNPRIDSFQAFQEDPISAQSVTETHKSLTSNSSPKKEEDIFTLEDKIHDSISQIKEDSIHPALAYLLSLRSTYGQKLCLERK